MKDRILINFAVLLHELMIIQNVTVKQLAKRCRIKRKKLKRILRAEVDLDMRLCSDLFFALDYTVRFTAAPKFEVPSKVPTSNGPPTSPSESTPESERSEQCS